MRALTALAAALIIWVGAPLIARASEGGGLNIAGFLPSGLVTNYPRMLVDDALKVGAAMGEIKQGGSRLVLYDLGKLSVIGKFRSPYTLDMGIATVDEANHRLLIPVTGKALESSGCRNGPVVDIAIFDLVKAVSSQESPWSIMKSPCTDLGAAQRAGLASATAGNLEQFRILGLHYYAPENKLYAAGSPLGDYAARSTTPANGRYGSVILIRQMNGLTGALEWDVDLRNGACDRIEVLGVGAFVARHGSDVYGYCYGLRSGTQAEGEMGYALRIPLEGGKPKRDENGQPAVITSPTLPNNLIPLLDPVSGRLLLFTYNRTNGTGVWVYDVRNERFFGVIASGLPVRPVPNATTWVGLDPRRGRTYLLTSIGTLVADARHTPLPAGLGYPLFSDITGGREGHMISVAPSVDRIFVPLRIDKCPANPDRETCFAIVKDEIPDPPPPLGVDLDAGTANIAEEEGKTNSVFLGAGGGIGGRLLFTGGVPRAVNNADPTCFNVLISDFFRDSQDRCISDQYISTGTRDLLIASSRIELGSQIGAAAFAAGTQFSTNDTATEADFKRLGRCESDVILEKSTGTRFAEGGSELADQMSSRCAQTPLSMFSGGTRDTDGRGFPVPYAQCNDFGTGAKEETQRPGSMPLVPDMIAASSVKCDLAGRLTQASSSATGLWLPDKSDPVVHVSRFTSSSSTKVTPEGIVTTIQSEASGVHIAGISIGRVLTSVTTKAKGKSGTTFSTFTRRISDVHGPGIDCMQCDPVAVVRAINRSLGIRARASLPLHYATSSPKGYQAVISKDRATRESDRAVNSDDSYEIPGLQIVFYNDGHDGRNRLILQLASVRGESRYGVFPVFDIGEPDFLDDFASDLSGIADDLGGPEVIQIGGTSSERPRSVIETILSTPGRLIAEGLSLIVNNPAQAVLLASLLALLASPVILGIRRRMLAAAVGA